MTHTTANRPPSPPNPPSANSRQYAYVAGIGMVNALGFNCASATAAVRAGISGYQSSGFFLSDEPDNPTAEPRPATWARVPQAVFDDLSGLALAVDDAPFYSEQYDHIIKLALLATEQALADKPPNTSPAPLLLAMAEPGSQPQVIPADLITTQLRNRLAAKLCGSQLRAIPTGRAAGIEAVDLALRCFASQAQDFILLGGSDSPCSFAQLARLHEQNRLLAQGVGDGFAPGEGACFLLLTQHPAYALVENHHRIRIYQPGIAQEPGHIHSEAPCLGEGLDRAFKLALHQQAPGIALLYNSMNGERYWAKEYGVAMLRNKNHFIDALRVEHPADCLGDLGAATGTTLMALAAKELWHHNTINSAVVYAASDGPARAAVVIEKEPVT